MLSSCDVYWKRKFPNLLRVTRVGGQKSAITYMIERKLQNYSYEHQKMESKENIENYYTHTHTHNQSKNEANGIGRLREAETVTSSHGDRILCKLKPAHKRKRLGLHSWKGKAGTMTRREKTGRARRCTHDDDNHIMWLIKLFRHVELSKFQTANDSTKNKLALSWSKSNKIIFIINFFDSLYIK